MLLSLFLVLLGLAVFLIVLGLAARESAYSIIGFIFLFVLATSILMLGNLAYHTGENTTTIYTLEGNVTLSTDAVTVENTSYYPVSSSRWFGIWLAFISVIGSFISIVDYRNQSRRPEDE